MNSPAKTFWKRYFRMVRICRKVSTKCAIDALIHGTGRAQIKEVEPGCIIIRRVNPNEVFKGG